MLLVLVVNDIDMDSKEMSRVSINPYNHIGRAEHVIFILLITIVQRSKTNFLLRQETRKQLHSEVIETIHTLYELGDD